MAKTLESFPHNQNRYDDQRDSIDESRERREPKPAESMARIGRATGKVYCDEGEKQRGGVGEHMARVGQQSQRARDQPTNHLDHHKGRSNAKREH